MKHYNVHFHITASIRKNFEAPAMSLGADDLVVADPV
jgi:hypothetical protein